MRITWEFDPHDEDDAANLRQYEAAKGMYLTLWELDQWLRSQHKYDAGEIEVVPPRGEDEEEDTFYPTLTDEQRRAMSGNAAYSVRDKLHELLGEENVDLWSI